MNIRTQIMVAVFAAAALFLLIYYDTRQQTEAEICAVLVCTAVGILIFGCFPSLTSLLADFLGIETPVNVLSLPDFVSL